MRDKSLGLKLNGIIKFGRVRPGDFTRLEKELGADGVNPESLAEEAVNTTLNDLEVIRNHHLDVVRTRLDWGEYRCYTTAAAFDLAWF